MTELYRGITIRRGEQQIGSKKLARRAFLFTPIDAITGQVGFKIDGPGQVDFGRLGRAPYNDSGDNPLRDRRRKDVAWGDYRRIGVAGFDRIAYSRGDH